MTCNEDEGPLLIEEEPNKVFEYRFLDDRQDTVARDFYVAIADTGEGYRLGWHDFVVNDWNEVYPDLSTALARAALLVHAAQYDRGFRDTDAASWYTRWQHFHEAWHVLATSATEPW